MLHVQECALCTFVQNTLFLRYFCVLCLVMGLMCLSCTRCACRHSSKVYNSLSLGCGAVQGVSGQVKERIELAARTGPDPNLRPLLLFPEVRKQDHLIARNKRPLRLSQHKEARGNRAH